MSKADSSKRSKNKLQDLTAGRIAKLECPAGKQQAFFRDKKTPGLAVRVTAAGQKSYIFETKLRRRNIRETIGSIETWSLEEARVRARELKVLVDRGIDPRELEKERARKQEAARAREAARSVTVGTLWQRYIEERKLHWGEDYYKTHLELAKAGGEPYRRWEGKKTKPGPLFQFMGVRLCDLNAQVIEDWAVNEAQQRAGSVRLSIRIFKAFLNWVLTLPEYENLISPRIIKNKRLKEAAGKPSTRSDYVQREQLADWFKAVLAYPNQFISAYLQCLVLTGARRGEMMGLRWADIDFEWNAMTIRDKVEGKRTIPLTPYTAHLLGQLPRYNEWVFASPRGKRMRIEDPSDAMARVCAQVGIKVTLHGLRRTFLNQAEWVDVPKGVSSQIAGHKPSALAEKHYIFRPIDLLRLHHERIERWLLKEAGVDFYPKEEPSDLQALLLQAVLQVVKLQGPQVEPGAATETNATLQTLAAMGLQIDRQLLQTLSASLTNLH